MASPVETFIEGAAAGIAEGIAGAADQFLADISLALDAAFDEFTILNPGSWAGSLAIVGVLGSDAIDRFLRNFSIVTAGIVGGLQAVLAEHLSTIPKSKVVTYRDFVGQIFGQVITHAGEVTQLPLVGGFNVLARLKSLTGAGGVFTNPILVTVTRKFFGWLLTMLVTMMEATWRLWSTVVILVLLFRMWQSYDRKELTSWILNQSTPRQRWRLQGGGSIRRRSPGGSPP